MSSQNSFKGDYIGAMQDSIIGLLMFLIWSFDDGSFGIWLFPKLGAPCLESL